MVVMSRFFLQSRAVSAASVRFYQTGARGAVGGAGEGTRTGETVASLSTAAMPKKEPVEQELGIDVRTEVPGLACGMHCLT